MPRPAVLLVLSALCTASAPVVQAGEMRRVPIEHDLDRLDRVDARLMRNGFIPVSRMEELERRGYGRGYATRDPSGVVGFSGPPGIIGDSVNSLSPLPPGSPASLDGQLY
ncbi:hypothetical protein [Methylobacterium sp. ID0610]|uniref:hypothetical protein n=1 Tax=Methylobacterium carpenticola TaxID=3344827 RepID=UPI0036B82DB7